MVRQYRFLAMEQELLLVHQALLVGTWLIKIKEELRYMNGTPMPVWVLARGQG